MFFLYSLALWGPDFFVAPIPKLQKVEGVGEQFFGFDLPFWRQKLVDDF
jgi:hypothetical protein